MMSLAKAGKRLEGFGLLLLVWLMAAGAAHAGNTSTGFDAFNDGISLIEAIMILLQMASLVWVMVTAIELRKSRGQGDKGEFVLSVIAAAICTEAPTGAIPGLNLQVALVV